MHLPESNGSSYAPAPSGAHVAICIGFIDLGTQKSTYMGETKSRHMVQLRWELVDEAMEDGRPFTITRRYTWSMSEKATLRADLEAWRGRPFAKEDLGKDGFNTKKLLGVPCLLNIVHKTSDSGSVFANIASIMPLPKGTTKPGASVNAHTYLALTEDAFDQATFEKLHDKTKEMIKASPEYRRLIDGEPVANEPTRPDFDDEIPF